MKTDNNMVNSSSSTVTDGFTGRSHSSRKLDYIGDCFILMVGEQPHDADIEMDPPASSQARNDAAMKPEDDGDEVQFISARARYSKSAIFLSRATCWDYQQTAAASCGAA